MSFQGKLKRYLLILERMAYRPTFAELKAHLEEQGFEISARTLQRDIEQVRIELGLEIAYDRNSNTYHLADGPDDRAAILPLLERAVLGELLAAAGGTIRQAAPHVVIECNGSLKGLHHWGSLLRAIRERREVVVSYQRFQTERVAQIRLRPVLLKEFRERWYVLGPAFTYDDPISLGLDRILGLRLTGTRFSAQLRDAVEAFYAPVIGVDSSPGKAERVVLRFTPLQGKYVKALPLHTSQRVVQDDAKGCVVELLVMTNYELRQELLGLGSAVEVLEPKALRTAIAAEHRKAALR